MTTKLGSNVDILYGNIDKKDLILGNLKTDLMSQMAEKRSREEEVLLDIFSFLPSLEIFTICNLKCTYVLHCSVVHCSFLRARW